MCKILLFHGYLSAENTLLVGRAAFVLWLEPPHLLPQIAPIRDSTASGYMNITEAHVGLVTTILHIPQDTQPTLSLPWLRSFSAAFSPTSKMAICCFLGSAISPIYTSHKSRKSPFSASPNSSLDVRNPDRWFSGNIWFEGRNNCLLPKISFNCLL